MNIKSIIKSLRDNHQKRFSFTHNAIKDYGNLSPKQQDLLLKMLTLVSNKCDVNKIGFKATYKELGFTDSSHFYRCRNKLIATQFIFYDQKDQLYFINPVMINYYSRRQLEYFYKHFGFIKEIPVNFGQKS